MKKLLFISILLGTLFAPNLNKQANANTNTTVIKSEVQVVAKKFRKFKRKQRRRRHRRHRHNWNRQNWNNHRYFFIRKYFY